MKCLLKDRKQFNYQLVAFIFMINGKLQAQCNWPSSASLYGTAAAGTTCTPVLAMSGAGSCHYFSEYATFTGLTSGQSYTITVTNTSTTSGTPFGLGVYTSNTSGTAPLSYASNATFPISTTFTATSSTVYTKVFKTGCVSTGSDCNYFSLTCNSCAAPSTSTNQPATSDVVAGTTSVQVLRLDIPVCSAGNLTSLTFATTGTTAAANILNAKVYFTTSTTFATTTQFGTTVVNPNGTFTVTGTQNIAGNSTGYLWLTYDVACNAATGNVLDAEVTSYTFGGTAASPATTNPTGTRAIASAGSYTANTATSTLPGTQAVTMGRSGVTGNTCFASVTEVKFNTSTSLPADISQAKCYYTTSTTFATTTPFGSAVLNPNGDITFTGSQTLASGAGNYFWLAYDVPCNAGIGDSLAAVPVSIVSGGNVIPVTISGTNVKKGITSIASYTATTTTNILQGSAGLSMGRTNITGSLCAGTVTQVKFNTATSLPPDISQAKCYYTTSTTFATTTPFGSAAVNPNGDITFTGSQAIATGAGNYFWLVYDLACNSLAGDSLIAVPVSITADGNVIAVATPTVNAKKGITSMGVYTATTTTNTIVGTADLSMGRTNITGSTCATTVTQVKFNTAASIPADISRAKCYYTTTTTFATTTPFGSAVVNPSGDITFTGAQAIASGSGNYFWLTYDVSCGSTVADSLIAIPVSITADGVTALVTTPATNAKKGIMAMTVPSYTASTTANVAAGTLDLSMGSTNITGNLCVTNVTQVKFNTATSIAADISQAKCYYTTSSTFATTTPFGTAVVSPSGDITFTGSQAIATGSGNYFWLAYDVSCTGVLMDSLVAVPVSITADGNTLAVATPSTNAKKGIIVGPAKTYTATTTTNVAAGTSAFAMGRTNISGTSCANNVTQVKFNTATSPAADIVSAKCFYTTSTTFNTNVPFGTAVVNPNGDITFTGTQALNAGSGNYFWLAYDVSCAAVLADSLTAVPVSITGNGTLYPVSTPATNAKKGVIALTNYNTIADGDWSSPSTWSCGAPPIGSNNVFINNNVTVSTSGNVAANITVAVGKALTISAGSLTMGAAGGDNKIFTNNGTLTVSGGTFNINGQCLNATDATFNQSGGNINVDPNAGSGSGTSLGALAPVNFTFTTAANCNLTGGTFTLVDPPSTASGAPYAMVATCTASGTCAAGPNHTFRFGDGISTSAGPTNGFLFYSWNGSGIFRFGKVILEQNTANAASRFVLLNGTYYNFGASDDITIRSGAELRQVGVSTNGAIYVGKNLTVETGGTLTAAGIVYFGNATSSSSTSLVLTPSTNAQVVSGGGVYRNSTTTSTANFASMTINNTHSAGVTFDANALLSGSNTGTVSGTFTLTAGMVNVGSNALVLGVSAASTGTYSYTAGTISGKFKRWMSASAATNSFDIGTASGSKKAVINFTTAPTTGGSLTASWNASDPDSNGLPLTEGSNTYTNASALGYWTITAGDGLTGGTYTATLTGTGMNDVSDYTALTIGKRATASDPWVLVGTQVTPTGSNANFTLSRTGMTGFSDFAVLNTQAPLEMKLTSFNGYNAGTVNNLNWTTASERDASHFEVMRSNDGKVFEKIGDVTATNKVSGSSYTFEDVSFSGNRNFYKLNMVDKDLKSFQSNVVMIASKNGSDVVATIYPNPTNNQIKIDIAGKIDGAATIQLLDAVGKIIKTFKVNGNSLTVDMNDIPSGNYIVKYVDNSRSFSTKVVKN